jgi:hypothetical protein
MNALKQGYAPPSHRRKVGLGDLVHAGLKPIVTVIDAVAGTNLKGCGGCAARREKLNEIKIP